MAELIYDPKDPSYWRVLGTIDYDSVVNLTEKGYQLLKNSGIKNAIIDFSGLMHFNSAILSMILCWYRFGLSLNIHLAFKALPVLAYKMAETYGLKFLWEER
jgi:anti-anti-sigma regulatory factor